MYDFPKKYDKIGESTHQTNYNRVWRSLAT